MIVPPARAQSVTGFQPPVLLGLKIHPENPLLFDFIIDRGTLTLSDAELKTETEKLIKYFLAALTIPEKEVWVNLSPYEQDRILPDILAKTQMGKTMLEQDYALKQRAAALTNPETDLGKKYWEEVNIKTLDAGRLTLEKTSVQSTPNIFSKVWIKPQSAEVIENNGVALVGEKRLQVLMDASAETSRSLEAFRSLILPRIEAEVNDGKDFAQVRQIYNSVILATWFKKVLKESLLGQVYADQSKVAGIETEDQTYKQQVYEEYLKAFQNGVYTLIKEEVNDEGELIPRKYFSGGAEFIASSAVKVRKVSSTELAQRLQEKTRLSLASTAVGEKGEAQELQKVILKRASTPVKEYTKQRIMTRQMELDFIKINRYGFAQLGQSMKSFLFVLTMKYGFSTENSQKPIRLTSRMWPSLKKRSSAVTRILNTFGFVRNAARSKADLEVWETPQTYEQIIRTMMDQGYLYWPSPLEIVQAVFKRLSPVPFSKASFEDVITILEKADSKVMREKIPDWDQIKSNLRDQLRQKKVTETDRGHLMNAFAVIFTNELEQATEENPILAMSFDGDRGLIRLISAFGVMANLSRRLTIEMNREEESSEDDAVKKASSALSWETAGKAVDVMKGLKTEFLTQVFSGNSEFVALLSGRSWEQIRGYLSEHPELIQTLRTNLPSLAAEKARTDRTERPELSFGRAAIMILDETLLLSIVNTRVAIKMTPQSLKTALKDPQLKIFERPLLFDSLAEALDKVLRLQVASQGWQLPVPARGQPIAPAKSTFIPTNKQPLEKPEPDIFDEKPKRTPLVAPPVPSTPSADRTVKTRPAPARVVAPGGDAITASIDQRSEKLRRDAQAAVEILKAIPAIEVKKVFGDTHRVTRLHASKDWITLTRALGGSVYFLIRVRNHFVKPGSQEESVPRATIKQKENLIVQILPIAMKNFYLGFSNQVSLVGFLRNHPDVLAELNRWVKINPDITTITLESLYKTALYRRLQTDWLTVRELAVLTEEGRAAVWQAEKTVSASPYLDPKASSGVMAEIAAQLSELWGRDEILEISESLIKMLQDIIPDKADDNIKFADRQNLRQGIEYLINQDSMFSIWRNRQDEDVRARMTQTQGLLQITGEVLTQNQWPRSLGLTPAFYQLLAQQVKGRSKFGSEVYYLSSPAPTAAGQRKIETPLEIPPGIKNFKMLLGNTVFEAVVEAKGVKFRRWIYGADNHNWVSADFGKQVVFGRALQEPAQFKRDTDKNAVYFAERRSLARLLGLGSSAKISEKEDQAMSAYHAKIATSMDSDGQLTVTVIDTSRNGTLVFWERPVPTGEEAAAWKRGGFLYNQLVQETVDLLKERGFGKMSAQGWWGTIKTMGSKLLQKVGFEDRKPENVVIKAQLIRYGIWGIVDHMAFAEEEMEEGKVFYYRKFAEDVARLLADPNATVVQDVAALEAAVKKVPKYMDVTGHKLGGNRTGGEASNPFVGPLSVQAGRGLFQFEVKDKETVILTYTPLQQPQVKATVREIQLGQRYVITPAASLQDTDEIVYLKYPENKALSSRHFSIVITPTEDEQQYLYKIEDLRSLNGTEILPYRMLIASSALVSAEDKKQESIRTILVIDSTRDSAGRIVENLSGIAMDDNDRSLNVYQVTDLTAAENFLTQVRTDLIMVGTIPEAMGSRAPVLRMLESLEDRFRVEDQKGGMRRDVRFPVVLIDDYTQDRGNLYSGETQIIGRVDRIQLTIPDLGVIYHILEGIQEQISTWSAGQGHLSGEVKRISASSSLVDDRATDVPQGTSSSSAVGGIDFDPSAMNLQIKRDGKGVPLPLPQQNLQHIHLDGLYPVILNIVPVNPQTLPLILGQNPSAESTLSLSKF